MAQDFKRRFIVSTALTVPIAYLSPMLRSLLGLGEPEWVPGRMYVLFALATIIFFYGGMPFLRHAWMELKKRQPGMMTLISLAVIVAYGYSAAVTFGLPGKVFYWELASLIDIMLLGHYIEMRSVMSAHGAMEELARLVPSKAHRLKDDGSTEDVPVSELQPDDRVLVKPGEKVPADGEVVDGRSSVNESLLTGESKPVDKQEGEEVIGGSVNGEGSLTVQVRKTGKDSFLNQVMDMVSKAQESKSRAQSLADKAAMWLTFVAIGSGAVTLVLWLALSGREFVFALERTVTVMIITCPHALGLAIPLVVAVSTAIAAKQGFLIRNRSPFEMARNIQAVIFDKTGTLTQGTFAVSDVVSMGELGEDELLELAGAVEAKSEHPIAKAIAESAREKLGSLPDAGEFDSIPGRGAKATVDGREVKTISLRYAREEGYELDKDALVPLLDEGKTVIAVIVDDRAAGVIALDDVLCETSRDAVARLKDMGLQVMMLTGDNEKVAGRVAKDLGLDDVFADVVPDEKAEKVKEVQQRGLVTAMVGDGVNDAPALAQADVGFAIGAGTDVAVETADVVLVKSNPMDVVEVVMLSKEVRRKTVQNLFWATGYNVVAIPLAAGVLAWAGIILSPAVGAIVMSLSTVIVAVNARLMSAPEAVQG
ncbi:heavy metal translocating P-type ATPase [Oceanidesulfovibrio indonesiensis]|uniref:Heavy metal translocating P-type ATPase n=2 Tax=Oceanidesulfovibrio indonesiensis TaxID=54767 RepID=A0A7M3MIQ3_9BACT|nr:heavy metal translocating P-type ATPase [Oceanidesulfovibrio indonesiensis]